MCAHRGAHGSHYDLFAFRSDVLVSHVPFSRTKLPVNVHLCVCTSAVALSFVEVMLGLGVARLGIVRTQCLDNSKAMHVRLSDRVGSVFRQMHPLNAILSRFGSSPAPLEQAAPGSRPSLVQKPPKTAFRVRPRGPFERAPCFAAVSDPPADPEALGRAVLEASSRLPSRGAGAGGKTRRSHVPESKAKEHTLTMALLSEASPSSWDCFLDPEVAEACGS